ncbi:methyl-accepting chemotaxis protein [Prosthecodimorpha staleyi]|uniref:HAMP domain-containing protein n=1 Tax=Prosthecodimorpha staleyi TaxID=2840188 RepID=A0A947DAY7_9HYPH|nr:methyl-accepting chemotaxis protein [Prosthecodimorpha staleyi]MBT9292047.1 HAMP domain-containing protein [Prosthecodimorpha staleyi]
MNGISVGALLRGAFGILAAVLLTFSAVAAWNAWSDLARADRLAKATRASAALFTALHNERLDRPGTQNELLSEQTRTEFSKLTTSSRIAVMNALATALPLLDALDFEGKTKSLPELQRLQSQLAALQAESLAAIAKPKAERRAGLAQDYVAAASALIDLLGKVSVDIAGAVDLDDPFIDRLFTIKQTAWVLRSTAGDGALLLVGGLQNRPVGDDAPIRHREALARSQGLWSILRDLTAGLPADPMLTDALAKVDAGYFEKDFQADERRLLATVASGGKAHLSYDDWNARIVPRLAGIVQVADAALAAALRRSEAKAGEARLWLAIDLAGVALAFLLTGAILLAVSRRVTTPLAAIRDRMAALAGGDLSVEAPYADRQDEIGALSRTMATFRDAMRRAEELRRERTEQEARAAQQRRQELHALAERFESAVGGVVSTVASAATQLQASSRILSDASERTAQESSAVAAATGQASANVTSAAGAAEELSGSVTEIARQVSQSAEIAARAVSEAKQTNAHVEGLARAADRIGSIVGLINSIAGQTNLLALNATIEAARAGEAGRGFAVVAAEVKQLADQTAKATAEIGGQVDAIQASTGATARAIEGIGGTIETMSGIASQIATAVEAQGQATEDIARSVNGVARDTNAVAHGIGSVTTAASESRKASAEVLRASAELGREAEVLRSEVQKFLATVRAA